MTQNEAKKTLRDEIESALDEVRTLLAMHKGSVEFVDVDDGVLSVRLTGSCHGCPLAAMTMRMGVERMVRERVPAIRAVRAVATEETRS